MVSSLGGNWQSSFYLFAFNLLGFVEGRVLTLRQAFEGLLRAEFRNLPGESRVFEGLYHLADTRRRGVLIKRENWSGSIFPGSRISMFMIVSRSGALRGECPRCERQRLVEQGRSAFLVW